METKKDLARAELYKNIGVFLCPLCKSKFHIKDYSMKCESGHNFDISKKGYINLFNGTTKIAGLYDKVLFSARKQVADSGLYTKLNKKLAELLETYKNANDNILDAGCGAGNIVNEIKKYYSTNSIFAIDLSKDGIDYAASNYNCVTWIVGNLNNLPFKDKSVGTILNVMSPANYSEFKRVMTDGAFLIKVVPDADYLKQLRNYIYKSDDNKEYSNGEVVNHLSENMEIVENIKLTYEHELKRNDLGALFDMTPLTADIGSNTFERSEIRKKFVEEHETLIITLAFSIVICKKNRES